MTFNEHRELSKKKHTTSNVPKKSKEHHFPIYFFLECFPTVLLGVIQKKKKWK